MKLKKSASYYYLVRMCSKIYVEEKWSHQDVHGPTPYKLHCHKIVG